MLESKDLKITQLSTELSHKNELLELQTQTLNKIQAEYNNSTPTPNRNLNALSNQKLNIQLPAQRYPQTTVHNSATNISPLRSFRSPKDSSLENLHALTAKINRRKPETRYLLITIIWC